MTLHALGSQFGSGGTGIPDLGKVLKEVQGLNISLVAGASVGTKMDIAAMRSEDTIKAVIAFTAGVPSDDTANCTIQSVRASGTITHSVGNPAADGTVVVNGTTYTYKTAPTLLNHVKIGTTFALTADNLATSINAYETRYGSTSEPQVYAVSNGSGVVTVYSKVEGAGNGPVVTSSDGTDLAVSNADPAAVTVTAAAVDNDDTVTVNGVVFTAKAAPTGLQQFLTINGDNTAQATEIARAVNAYASANPQFDIVATPALAVVTFAPKTARKGNIITLTENATNVAVSGSGFLAGGTNTGGFKSTTDLSTKPVLVFWYNKR